MLFLLFSAVLSVNVCIYIENQNECGNSVDFQENLKFSEIINSEEQYKKIIQKYPGETINIVYPGQDDASVDDQSIYLNFFKQVELRDLRIIIKSPSSTPSKYLKLDSKDLYNDDPSQMYKSNLEIHGFILNFASDTFNFATLKIYDCKPVENYTLVYWYAAEMECSFDFLLYLLSSPDFNGEFYFNTLRMIEDSTTIENYTQNDKLRFAAYQTEFVYTNKYDITLHDLVDDSHFKVTVKKGERKLVLGYVFGETTYITFRFGEYVQNQVPLKFVRYSESKVTEYKNLESPTDYPRLYFESSVDEPYIQIDIDSLALMQKCIEVLLKTGKPINTKANYSIIDITSSYSQDTIPITFNPSNDFTLKLKQEKIIFKDYNPYNLLLKHKMHIEVAEKNKKYLVIFNKYTGNIFDGLTPDNQTIKLLNNVEIDSPNGTTIAFQNLEYGVTQNNLVITSILTNISNKMQCGTLQIGKIDFEKTLDTDKASELFMNINYIHTQQRQYDNRQINELFPGEYTFLIDSDKDNRKLSVQQPSSTSTHHGFIRNQSILEITKESKDNLIIHKGFYNATLYETLPTAYCIALRTDSKYCANNSLVINFDDDLIVENLPNGEKSYKAKTPSFMNDKINQLITESSSDCHTINLDYLITEHAYDQMGYNVPYLDCSKLHINTNYQIGSHNSMNYTVRFGLNNQGTTLTGTFLRLDRLKIVSNLEPDFKMYLGSCNFDMSSGNMKINDKVTIAFTQKDLVELFNLNDDPSKNKMFCDKGHIIIRAVQPLHLYGVSYGKTQRIFVRPLPEQNIYPMQITFKCSDMKLYVNYPSNQPMFENSDRRRFVISYDAIKGDTSPTEFSNIVIPDFKGYAEINCGELKWPGSFRGNTPIIELQNPENTEIINVILNNYSAPFLGSREKMNFFASKYLQLDMLEKETIFELGGTMPRIKFTSLSFDTKLKDKSVGIYGCTAVLEKLELKYNTTAAFESVEIAESLTLYPGAKLSQKLRTISTSSSTDFCDVFGKTTKIYWNSMAYPTVTLNSECVLSRKLDITYQFDPAYLDDTFHATDFVRNYFQEPYGAPIIENLMIKNETSEEIKNSVLKPKLLPPAKEFKGWDVNKPEMEIHYNSKNIYLGITDDYRNQTNNGDNMTDDTSDGTIYVFDNKWQKVGLIVLIVFLVTLTLIMWSSMILKYGIKPPEKPQESETGQSKPPAQI